MKNILITGKDSYIGVSFEKYIRQFEGYYIETVDMVDGSWRNMSFEQYDVVFHVAGIAHSDFGKISEDRKSLYYSVNTELAIETAKKAKAEGVKLFVFMSSASVYGESAPIGKSKLITKDTALNPTNFYGDSKVQAEKGLHLLEDENFKIVILRPPMIYGEGCKGNYPTLSKFAKKLPVFPYVNNERSMLYVGNLTEFIKLMIDNDESGVFFPQNAEYTNTSEVVKTISQINNKKLLLIKGCSWALKIMSKFTGLVNKAFGNLTYDMKLSEYKCDYRKFTLEESICITEGKSQQNKPRAMMLASVASMIDQFNMSNIQLLQDKGYDVDVVCSLGTGNNISDDRIKDLVERLSNKDVKVYDVPIPRKISNIVGVIKSIKRVKQLARDNHYDLVHCHSPIGSVVARMAMKSKRKSGTKIFYTAHGFHFYEGAPKINWLLFYPIEKYFSKYTDVLITINKEDYGFAQDHMKAARIEYVPGIGVDTKLFKGRSQRENIRTELGIGSTDIVVLSVGELNSNKNHETIIRALSVLGNDNIHYVIAGKGEKVDELTELADSLGVHLHLLGYRTDVDQLYSAADIYAFPSYREGLSVSLMEAMASGLPVVCSRIRGNTDLIEHGKGGYLYDCRDVDGFAQGMKQIIESDSSSMGQINIDTMKGFDIERVNAEMLRIYSQG